MTDLTTQDGGPATSRRALLGAAWTAPVIVAAGTAPAYAASAAASLVFDTFTAYPTSYTGAGVPTRIEGKIQVRRAWSATGPAVKSLTVSVVIPASVAAGGKASSVSGTGWTDGSVSGPAGGNFTYTFTWTGKLDNSNQSTPELVFVVKRTDSPSTVASLTAYATSPQATSATRTISSTI
ncbi:hypothetical protein J2X46_000142 [Nocardioides sp. BE266]|uniref:hypothetical protein n=1 Tax=Nocardioides sp. BE266 TaxID=2817725 RepID=UPI00285E7699|nr:hypothetical protein [Nocardioides sp. BE266]MDR7251170.1 hypothetical protein [Nocardioides sp. BE266]